MYSQIASNKQKTWLLIGLFVVFIWFFGWVIAQALARPGLFVVVAIGAVIYSLISYFAAAKLTLTLARAKPVTKAEAPELYRVVENLSIASGLPLPAIYVIADAAPNAFATGRDPAHAAVAVTTGLIEIMDKSELEGVIAHELSHVGNYDIRLMALVVMLVGVISLVSHFFLRFSFWGGDDNRSEGGQIFALIGIVLSILSPIVATLVQLAVSRRREFLADASGALLTRYPQGLESALQKIAQVNRPVAAASPATAHLYFANPLRGGGVGASIAKLFDTHPPIAERIAKLQAMERSE